MLLIFILIVSLLLSLRISSIGRVPVIKKHLSTPCQWDLTRLTNESVGSDPFGWIFPDNFCGCSNHWSSVSVNHIEKFAILLEIIGSILALDLLTSAMSAQAWDLCHILNKMEKLDNKV